MQTAWANDSDNRHSTSGNNFLMAGGAVSWTSQKHPTVPLSTSETEYMALGSATQETIWLQCLLCDLQVNTTGSTKILEVNRGAIVMMKNPVGHKRAKCIDVKHHLRSSIYKLVKLS